jgi:hypothetical protein
MAGNLIIPNPLESSATQQQLTGVMDTAVPIVQGKLLQKMPEPLAAIAGNIISPPSPQDIIRDFLFKSPEPQKAVPAKSLQVPKPDSTFPMQPLGGNALNGDPIYSRLEIRAKNFTGFNGVVQGFPDMKFDTVLIKSRQHKNIVETEIQGNDDGAVFEYSGLNSYDIEISIIVTSNKNGVYPQADMDNLVKMLKSQVSVEVDSWYLQMLDIYEIVIVDYDISQEPGGISQQNVTIQARSNKRTTLIIQ